MEQIQLPANLVQAILNHFAKQTSWEVANPYITEISKYLPKQEVKNDEPVSQ